MRRSWSCVAALILVTLQPGCGSSDDPAPRSVPGTSAFVGDHSVSPLHEGQYVGQLEKVEGGNTCSGRSGSEGPGSISVTLHTDEQCRVFVEDIGR
jgi:hypothetical protein